MRSQVATHTIQCWPGGGGYEYSGDPHGPAGQKRLRVRQYNGAPQKPWRRGLPKEWREIRIEIMAQIYQERDIYQNQTMLIGDLMKLDSHSDLAQGFEYDQVENLYADPSDWDAEKCREYAKDAGIDLPALPTLGVCPTCKGATIEGPPCLRCQGTGDVPDPAADTDDSDHGWLTEAQLACIQCAQEHPAEVYEWYAVSAWLCKQLREIGEVVIENDYGAWWGRCATGQALIMDGVLQRIAAKWEDR